MDADVGRCGPEFGASAHVRRGMNNKLIALVALSLTAVTGCAVRVARPDVRPVPQRQERPVVVAPQRMNYDEAVHRALDYARVRGFEAEVKEAHLTGNDIWKVKLDVVRPDAKGKLHVELDAYSREVLRAQEHVKYKKAKHAKGDRRDDRDDDDDDDEDYRSAGRGKVHCAAAVAER